MYFFHILFRLRFYPTLVLAIFYYIDKIYHRRPVQEVDID